MSGSLSEDLLSQRSQAIDVSGIRRVFQLGAQLKDPINLSIGQPDFPVPAPLKQAAIDAIAEDCNGYTLTAGDGPLLAATRSHLAGDLGWTFDGGTDLLITSGTSGALQLVYMSVMNEDSEAIVPDPYFVIYPNLAPMFGGRTVLCDTGDDLRMTAERVERVMTDKTRLVLVNTPANPTGVVLNQRELDDLYDLCTARGVLLVCDEIYDLFTFDDALEGGRFPSPARRGSDMLLIRGLGKNYGCTGWRLGYAAGPDWLIQSMAKLQQYTYVCAPSMAQRACVGAFDIDMSSTVKRFQKRRDMVMDALSDVTEVAPCGGAFYAWAKVPGHLGLSGTAFATKAVDHNVLVIPGGVFSERDTHFRISFACDEDRLRAGLDVLRTLLRG
ncbi:MAG: pyridoxal phosphate-dependent aminotransferase [Phycisphaerales bacterium]|nr:pyridoxal phosphate-dependent aminotransferase [Phycisphaerales bacterium]